MAKITYTDKVTLNTNSSVAAINKCQASDLNQIKNGVNQVGSYTTLVAGSTAGQFYCTLEGTLASGDIINISVPSATTNLSSSFSLSINGGTTYYSLLKGTNNIQVGDLQGMKISIYFDGSNFQYISAILPADVYNAENLATDEFLNGKRVWKILFYNTNVYFSGSTLVTSITVANKKVYRVYFTGFAGDSIYSVPFVSGDTTLKNYGIEMKYSSVTYFTIVTSGNMGQSSSFLWDAMISEVRYTRTY